jgi:uncharacterized protein
VDDQDLNYPRMLQAALRDVARQALQEVAENGFPGDHHFFIQLSPQHPEVIVPGFLRKQYPEELTLVLQRQYWNLEVDEDRFQVTLSFNGKRYDLEIPFDALIGFADPAANFALRFEALLPGRRGPTAEAVAPEQKPGQKESKKEATKDGKRVETGGAKIVEIDSFRKPR